MSMRATDEVDEVDDSPSFDSRSRNETTKPTMKRWMP